MTRPGGWKFGAELQEHFQKLRPLKTLRQDQGGRIGLFQYIFQFLGFEPGIHRDEDGPDIGQGKYRIDPFGPIGQPNRHLIPGFHPRGQQSAGELFHSLEEMPIGYPLLVDYQEFAIIVKASGFFYRETYRYGDPATHRLFSPELKILYTLSYQ